MKITTVERSGRQSDSQWLDYQSIKEKEHRLLYGNNFFKLPMGGDKIRFDCAFLNMDGRLKDPAGYNIISYDFDL